MPTPLKKYNFAIVIQNIKQADFSEVSAPDVVVEPIEYRAGVHDVHKATPGRPIKYECMTAKRGSSDCPEFINWIKKCNSGQKERKTIMIYLLGDNLDDIKVGDNRAYLKVGDNFVDVKAKWELKDAWPVKYSAPDHLLTDSEVSFEYIEFEHQGFTRTT